MSTDDLNEELRWACSQLVISRHNVDINIVLRFYLIYVFPFTHDRQKYMDDLVQDCNICIANALEILQCCIKPSICTTFAFCCVFLCLGADQCHSWPSRLLLFNWYLAIVLLPQCQSGNFEENKWIHRIDALGTDNIITITPNTANRCANAVGHNAFNKLYCHFCIISIAPVPVRQLRKTWINRSNWFTVN